MIIFHEKNPGFSKNLFHNWPRKLSLRIRSADFVDFGGHCEVSVKCFDQIEASMDLGFFVGDRYGIVA